MIADKLQHNLIKINQLVSEEEPIRYIIPLYYNAFKCVSQNHYQIQAPLLELLFTRYHEFYHQNIEEIDQLDQIHTYMHEQCMDILKKHCNNRMQKQKTLNNSRLSQRGQSLVAQNSTIVIPQEKYYFDQQHQTSPEPTPQPSYYQSKSGIVNLLSLDDIPYQHKSQDKIMTMWNHIQQMYRDHRIDQAKEQCQIFQSTLFLYDPNCKLSPKRYQLINSIFDQYDVMTSYYQYLDQPGYKFDKSQKGVDLYYKIYEETKEVAVRVQAQIEVPFQRFMCIISEVDLYQQLVPFSYDTKELKQISRNRKIGLSRVSLPLISNRQAFFVATAYDRLQTQGSIFFFSKTITSNVQWQKKLGFHVQASRDLVQLQYKFYIIQYIPTGYSKGRVRLATNIDLKLDFLPHFVINRAMRIFAFDYFKNILKCNKNFVGSPWEKKMNENIELYSFFKNRIQRFLEQKR